MKKVAILWGCLVFAQACCLADEIVVDGVAYTNVTVFSVGQSTITLRLSSGRAITKDLAEVDKITLARATKFNQAEEQFSKQRYAEAIELYGAALKTTSDAQRKTLIRRRLALAKERQAAGPAGQAPHPGTKVGVRPADSFSCPACKGTGCVSCPECEGTGLVRCKDCNGTGRVTCPTCKGHWEQGRCAGCKGAGGSWVLKPKRVTKETLGGRVRRHVTVMERVWVPCNHFNPGVHAGGKYHPGWYCGGRKGYKSKWYCLTCENEPVKAYKGTALCPACQGKGGVGQCAACKASQKVPCKACNGTGRRPLSEAEAEQLRQLQAGALASADALATALAKGPADPREDKAAWAKLTRLQQAEKLRSYNEDLDAWREGRRFIGLEINWRMTLKDIGPAEDGQAYLVQSYSDGGVLVEATVSATAAREVLLGLKKSQPIQLRGIIAAYRIGQEHAKAGRAGKGNDRLCIEIDRAVVTPPDKSGS